MPRRSAGEVCEAILLGLSVCMLRTGLARPVQGGQDRVVGKQHVEVHVDQEPGKGFPVVQ